MNELKRILYPIVQRQQQWRTWNMFLYWWGAVVTISGLILIRSYAGSTFPDWTPHTLTALLLVGTFAILWINSSSTRFDYRQLARDIEEQHPELHATLLTAIEQQPNPKTGQLNFLQQRVIDEARGAYETSQFCKMIPKARLLSLKLGLTVLFAMTCLCLGKLYALPEDSFLQAEAADKNTEPEKVADALLDKVEPGHTEVERGSPLAILAHFKNRAPGKAVLVVSQANKTTRQLELIKNLDDPIFGATLPVVEEAISYHVDYDGKKSETYQVTVYKNH